MAFNIEEFKSNINKNGGLAKPGHYQVMIPTVGGGSISVDSLSLFCDSAVLPGMNLQTGEFRYTGYGKTEKRPYMVSTTDAPMTFLADVNGGVQEFFQKWLFKINKFTDSKSGGAEKDTFSYPNDYVVDIDIDQYSQDGTKIMTYKLIRAFPVTMGDVTISWSERDNIMRIPVQFSYLSWTSDKLE